MLTPDWLEPGWWCWLPITSPTDQKNIHKLITHPTTLLPHPVFKDFTRKPSGSPGLLSTSCPGFLAWCPAINSSLSFTTTGVSSLALCTDEWAQVWSGDSTITSLLGCPITMQTCCYFFHLKFKTKLSLDHTFPSLLLFTKTPSKTFYSLSPMPHLPFSLRPALIIVSTPPTPSPWHWFLVKFTDISLLLNSVSILSPQSINNRVNSSIWNHSLLPLLEALS